MNDPVTWQAYFCLLCGVIAMIIRFLPQNDYPTDMLAQLEVIQGRLAAMKRAAAGAYCSPAKFIREWFGDDAGLKETINKAKGVSL